MRDAVVDRRRHRGPRGRLGSAQPRRGRARGRRTRLGGRIRSEARDPYWLNLGAHVFSGPGSATGRLVADVGVESVPVPGHLVALELNGRLLVGGRPELYPLRLPLRPAERAALARAGARLRVAVARYERVATPAPGESPAETQRRLLAHGDDRTFADWLGPAARRCRPRCSGPP